MAVPLDVRQVERPKNTIVDDNGGNGPNRYAVRARGDSKYIPGHNPQPKNGRVLGHIVDGRFVPIQNKTAYDGSDMLSYGAAALVKSVATDILSDLLDVYPVSDAYSIIAIASLRVIKPKITAVRMSSHYRRTFISVFYPGAAVSQNSICTLLQKIGQDGGKRKRFYLRRMEAVAADHHIAIDGTLIQDTSKVNDLSAFSYKARTKGRKEISVLYAYDIEQMEPVCAEVFPRNSTDATSYSSFIRDNDIKRGIIVADKGFPPSAIKEELEKRPDLHFLTPIKRNDTRIGKNDMLSFEGVLTGFDDNVVYTKREIKGGRFLYAFKSAGLATLEVRGYLTQVGKKKSFDGDEYKKKDRLSGVIVFESDLDMPPETVYRCYDDRWLLELVFRQYKSDECLDSTRIQNDFSVIGSEFINFISTLITCRIVRKARSAGVLKDRTYSELMEDLSQAWRMTGYNEPPRSDDGRWIHTMKYELEELEKLGLSIPAPKPEQKKRGRPRKNPETVAPKRPRGRPRKNPVPDEVL
ncbi:MAG: transposase [Clostridiales Family XIII bacterium]|jgi:transposase|nr:transposase [Clostridiales Family XIII bacterium]